MSFIIIMPLLFREECLLGISVHSVVSREFSFLFFVPQCFLCCLLSPDVPFLVVSADLPYLVPFFFRLPSDRDERPLSSARDPSIHSTEDNKNRVTMTIRSAAIECWTTNQRLLKSTNGVQRGTERGQLRVPPLVRLTILCCSTDWEFGDAARHFGDAEKSRMSHLAVACGIVTGDNTASRVLFCPCNGPTSHC